MSDEGVCGKIFKLGSKEIFELGRNGGWDGIFPFYLLHGNASYGIHLPEHNKRIHSERGGWWCGEACGGSGQACGGNA